MRLQCKLFTLQCLVGLMLYFSAVKTIHDKTENIYIYIKFLLIAKFVICNSHRQLCNDDSDQKQLKSQLYKLP